MTAPAGSAAAFREARRGKPIASSRQASLANMRALIAAGEAGAIGDGDPAATATVGRESMRRELEKQGMVHTR